MTIAIGLVTSWHINRAISLYLRYADPALANPHRESDNWAAFLDFCAEHNLDADAIQYHCDECLATLYEFHKKRRTEP